LLRNEYLAEENRILRGQIKGRLLLSEGEKATLAEIGHRLGRKALEDVAATAKPETILGWYRKLIANKFDGSKFRRSVGRPRVDQETERLVVQMARENPSWGYDRIVGALANVGRQGSGIKSTGQRALGSQSAHTHILRILGMSHRKKASRPHLSSREAGQCVLAQGGDYDRTSFSSIRW
jgi:hypothetical protein